MVGKNMKIGWKDINIVNYRQVSFCHVKVRHAYGTAGLSTLSLELKLVDVLNAENHE